MAFYYTAASADDANQVISSGAVVLTNTGTEAGAKLDGTNHAGFRFGSIALARNDGIVKAVLKFPTLYNYTGSGKLTNTTVYGENVANSAQFTTATNNISTRTKTVSRVLGSNLNANAAQFETTGVDVTKIVKEITTRTDWASGNALSILFIGNGTAGNFVQPYMYDYFSGTYKASLEITTATGTTYTFPTGFTSDTSSGTGTWSNTSNLTSTNATYATATISSGGQSSYILKTTGYGFAIPANAKISGIQVKVVRKGTSAMDRRVQMLKGGSYAGYRYGKDKYWSSTDETVFYGGVDDLWGTSWTAADINDANFGFAYQVGNVSGGGNASVDSISVVVYYSNPTISYVIEQAWQPPSADDFAQYNAAGIMTAGNQAYGQHSIVHAITNNTGHSIDVSRIRWTFAAIYGTYGADPKTGLGGTYYDRTGTPIVVSFYNSLANASANTSPITTATQYDNIKSIYKENYDYYLATPITLAAGATIYADIEATGVSGVGEPGFITHYGNTWSSDDDSNQITYGFEQGSGFVAKPNSLFYELYSTVPPIPDASAFPVGDSNMTVDGSIIQYSGALPVGDSDVTVSGYQVHFNGVSQLQGDSVMTADRITPSGGSNVTVTGTLVPLTITKTYMYKIYDQNWNYLGAWNDVVSEFGYSQEINSAGSAIEVTLARNSDSLISEYSSLGDDSNVAITTDDGSEIAAEVKTLNAIGPGTSVDLNLNVKIYEYSNITQDVTGDLVFTGYISKYTSQYGSQEQTRVSIFSYGADLDNWVLSDAGNTRVPYFSVDPSTMLRDSLDKFQAAGGLIGYEPGTAGSTVVETNLITNPSFQIDTTGWTIGTSGSGSSIARITTDSYYDTASLQVNAGTAINGAAIQVANLVIGQQYTVQARMKATAGQPLWINTFGISGVATTFTTATGGWDLITRTFTPTVTSGGISMGINTASGTCYIDAVMLTKSATAPAYFDGSTNDADIQTTFAWTGTPHASTSTKTTVTPTVGSSIDDTGTIATYVFNLNTELEVIKKGLEIAPTDWYFYTDLATNKLHYHARSSTPDHYFYLGKHILSLNLERTIEGLTNDVYFTGGKPTNVVLNKFNAAAGTALAGITGQVGGAWVRHTGSNASHSVVVTDVNRIRGNATAEGIYYVNTVIDSTDYTVEADFVLKSLAGNSGIVGRVDSASLNYYLAKFDITVNKVQLFKCISGTFTLLQEFVLPTGKELVAGQTRHVELKMQGAQISVIVDNQKYLDLEDRSIVYGSYAGVRLVTADTNTTSAHIDNFQVQLLDNSGAPSVFKRYTDNTSISLYRRGLERISDNRVTLASSADLIVNSQINRFNTPRYRSNITISNSTYEIKRIKLGQIVGFRNFGNYVDTVTMQIVRIDYTPDAVTLQLDTLLPSVPKRLEDIKRNLAQSEVEDNPDAPTT